METSWRHRGHSQDTVKTFRKPVRAVFTMKTQSGFILKTGIPATKKPQQGGRAGCGAFEAYAIVISPVHVLALEDPANHRKAQPLWLLTLSHFPPRSGHKLFH